MDKTIQEFINAGFTVLSSDNDKEENKLIKFLKEHYPNIIKDNEINVQELKTAVGLPVDEKVNGYGLNFVGRNVARARYAQKTNKELKVNTEMSKNFDTTQNLVLKGDNLDCLKILKNYYSGKIKCIYIDPPYNTGNDDFVYPDKFDKEESEVLGLANLSDDDFARMVFTFKTKKSHSGWLAFMYPRLLLARDLLSDDGVIFISIDDNEQANLKLLCDEIFGEENFLGNITVVNNLKGRSDDNFIATANDYLLVYAKNKDSFEMIGFPLTQEQIEEYNKEDDVGKYKEVGFRKTGKNWKREARPNLYYPIYYNENTKEINLERKNMSDIEILPITTDGKEGRWRWNKEKFLLRKDKDIVIRKVKSGRYQVFTKMRINENGEERTLLPKSIWIDPKYDTTKGSYLIKEILGNEELFDNPKPIGLIKDIIITCIDKDSNSIILDFFAGSGTTGHAVMQLNAEDGGNRKFILVQIDEPIKEDKPAYKFCKENNLPPVISSITIERLKRAGEKIKKEIEEENNKEGLFEENKKKIPDIGFKVFDTVDAPRLELAEDGKIKYPEINLDPLSRIYNMIFTVGLDEPTQTPEEVVKDCVYKVGDNYYITNSDKVSKEQFAECIKRGKVFIDGWTASLNATLQNYKEDIKIVF